MKGKKTSDLDRAEEIGKEIQRQAMDEKKDILKRVDEDVLKELSQFQSSIQVESIDNSQSLLELERRVAKSKDFETDRVREQLEKNQDRIIELLIENITTVSQLPS